MEKLTINNRVYPAKELDFNFLCELGNENIDISELESKIMPAIRVYVAYCMGVDVKVAGSEINDHIINGGTINEIADVFSKMAEESGFFRALNKTATEETTETTKKRAKKTEEVSE